ncbi:C1 family peptidase [bacterium]|nr:C1 family peptidase [bacterium]
MKTKAFAWLSSTVVLAGILAGCGINSGVGINSGATVSKTTKIFADGNGVARRFGYKFVGGHLGMPGIGLPNRALLPASVDLRTTGKVSPVYDQGQLGACTAFAMGKGLRETLTNMSGAPSQSLSAMYLYYKERERMGTINEDSGAMMVDGMEVLKANGNALDSTMPYVVSKFKEAPSAKAEAEAAAFKIEDFTLLNGLDQLKAELAKGNPGVFGYTVYKSFMTPAVAKTGMMPMPKPGEQILGGHAVFIVGYDDAKQVLIIKNSWGGGWGDKGYFYMPYAYVTADKVDEIYVAKASNR